MSNPRVDPKKSAKTVQVSVMTLYGMLKSGVGKRISKESVKNLVPSLIIVTTPEPISKPSKSQ